MFTGLRFLLPGSATIEGSAERVHPNSVEVPKIKQVIARTKRELEKNQERMVAASTEIETQKLVSDYVLMQREELRYWEHRLRQLTEPEYARAVQSEFELQRKARITNQFRERVPSKSTRTMILLCAPRTLLKVTPDTASPCWLRVLPIELLRRVQSLLFPLQIAVLVRPLEFTGDKPQWIFMAAKGRSVGQSLVNANVYQRYTPRALVESIRFRLNGRLVKLNLSPDVIGISSGDELVEEDLLGSLLV